MHGSRTSANKHGFAISNGKSITAINHVDNLYRRSKESRRVFPDQIKVVLPTPDLAKWAHMYKVISESKSSDIFVAECTEPGINQLSVHKNLRSTMLLIHCLNYTLSICQL